jgi:signal transduction histidine kinase
MGIIERYDAWVESLDMTFLQSGITVEGWAGTGLFLGGIFAAIEFIPGLESALRFNPAPAMIVLAICVVHGSGTALAIERGISRRAIGVHLMIGDFLLALCGIVAVAESQSLTRIFFVGTYYIICLLHGYAMKATIDRPFILFSLGLAGGVGALLYPELREMEYLLLLVSMGIFFAALVGDWSRRIDRFRQESLNLRDAIRAKEMEEQTRRLSALSRSLNDVLGYRHDINNTLTVLNFNIRALGETIEEVEEDTVQDELDELYDDIDYGISKMSRLLDTLLHQDLLREDPGNLEAFPIVEETRRAAGVFANHRDDFDVELDIELDEDIELALPGGDVTWDRILINLMRNAMQGDGERGADRVCVTLESAETDPFVTLTFEDDGPGFPEFKLEPGNAFRALFTTKEQGTGLGLYTVKSYISAAGGSVRIDNESSLGGARVRIKLPQRPPAVLSESSAPAVEELPVSARGEGARAHEEGSAQAESGPAEGGSAERSDDEERAGLSDSGERMAAAGIQT